MFLAATSFLALLIFIILLIRLKSQMAALVAWIVGTITGARAPEDPQDQDKKTSNETEKSKSKKSRYKPKKSPTGEPSFSTTLTTPIEEVIEETLKEETKSSVEAKPKKPKKRNKSGKSKTKEQLNVVKTSEESSDSPTSPIDSVGFSFLPVKDRKKKNPKPKIDDLLKSPEHYQSRKTKKPVEEFVVVERTDVQKKKPLENVIQIVNKESGKTVFVEAKESKKVHAKISYASVASQRFEESLEQLRKEETLHLLTEERNSEDTNRQLNLIDTLEKKEEATASLNNEELVHEIQSEERRLVDLLEDDHAKTEETASNEDTDSETAVFSTDLEDREETQFALDRDEKILETVAFPQEIPRPIENPVVSVETVTPLTSGEIVCEGENRYIEREHQFVHIEETGVVFTDDTDLIPVVENHFSNIKIEENISSVVKEEISSSEESVQSEGENEENQFVSLVAATSNEEIVEIREDIEEHITESEKTDSVSKEEQAEEIVETREDIESVEENITESEETDSVSREEQAEEVVESREDKESVEENITESEETDSVSKEQTEEIFETREDKDSVEENITGSEETDSVSSAEQAESVTTEETEFEKEDKDVETVESWSNGIVECRIKTDDSLIEEEIQRETVATEELEVDKSEIRENGTKPEARIKTFLTEGITKRDTLKVSAEFIEREISSTIPRDTLKPFKMSSGVQVRVLTLNDKEHQDSTLYRLEKNWILQFRLGPSLLGRKVLLYCNYPKENEFRRDSYHPLKWHQDEGCTYSDDTALLTEITVKIAGSFHYYFVYQDDDKDKPQGSGFFLVDPVLTYGNNEKLPLDCIQCQTFLAKGLGPFNTWENKLKVAQESGYNTIHFTPIQELGASNSSYSLSEQLKVNPLFKKQNGEETTFQDVENLIKKIRTEWKMVSICDIVLNHTANESKWLEDHPEVTYNCQNCPYMRPSYLLDAALHQFSIDVSKGLYEDKGIPPEVTTDEHVNAIRYYLPDVLSKLKIYELFTCDVSNSIAEFLTNTRNNVLPNPQDPDPEEELELIQDPQFRRLSSTVDMKLAVRLYNVYRRDCYDEETRIKKCTEELKHKLDSLNKRVIDKVNDHLRAAVENVIAGIRYFRVQHDGPRLKEISTKHPLVDRYFTDYGKPANIQEHETIMYSDKGRFLMAHNGWVMNSDPLRNFAAPGSNVYLRRELIAWGDSVKLRYGDKPEDCPFLWQHMREYVEMTARIFDGVRLDNCHSTPIPVAEYLLDCARSVKPDLYVVAELFTNSDLTDNVFVNRLGISSLIREAMSAWDSHEQGRLVYRYGGSPVGSFYQPRIRPLVPSIAHALFLDLTHDNPSPVEKRSVFDLLPSTALVNMACCASGSNRGYDELVPHHIHVVDETRQYTEWTDNDNLATGNSRYVTKKSGIIAAKKAINDLHYHLGAEGFSQVYVDQMDPDVVAVTRHCPETHQSYVLVAFTAFSHPPEDAANYQRGIKPLRVEGVLDEIVLEASLDHIKSVSKYAKNQNFHKDSKWINGLSEYQVHVKQHIQPDNSDIFEKVDSGTPNVIQLNFKNFKPGSVAVIKVSLRGDMCDAITNVRRLINQFSLKKESDIWKIVGQMTLADLNRALYRCGQEERDEGHGFDTYNIPNFESLVYAGFQGFMSLLCNIRPSNDLGHPMCANLRDGNWMIDYIWQRLKLDPGTKSLGQWFEENTKSLKSIPRYLIPCYFDVIVTGIYILLLEQSQNLMSDFVKNGSTFVRGLAMGSVQFAGYIKSADLPALSPNLAEPKPLQRKNDNGETVQACVTLSAGLPHFSVGYMRSWGRDTFIALRGLFLLTGRYQDARYHILGYAACLRHGLIPNLLDGGRNSRFNCRDAIWWWLYCIKCYTEDAPNGLSILTDKVSRLFPTDDSAPQPSGTVDQPLQDVIQEALTVHFQGLHFRERNAGRQIDEHMTDNGFNNQIGIHPETGFVFGGNSSNCGTWMDKMGSSEKAGNRGKPATPRDGSAVELIGLSKAAVTWLNELSKKGVYPYKGVERTGKNGIKTKWTFKEWADKIQTNFEKYFWINPTPVEGEIRPDLINKRGIYKDCYGASQEWTDYQLRCNFPVAMVAAPELFEPEHAWTALQQAEKYLLGPLGMKTLDPEDWAYNGYYDNSNDSNDHNVAHGFNYHQGPEWVWPVGFYLRARLQFAAANGELAKTVANTKVVLSKHFVELQTSTWRGLPELTNKDGAYCHDSSRTQAWSMSSILEVLHDLQKIERTQPLIN